MTIPHRAFSLLILACCIAWPTAHSQMNSASQPSRTVKGQVLTSTSLPSIRVEFDKQFKYVGTQKFILYGRSQAEQFFFVDADKRGQMKRMYLIQFEGYLPNTTATYDYAGTETVTLQGQTYMANNDSTPNLPAVLKQRPESDFARAVAFLANKGLHIPDAIKFRRFVRLVDDAKRNEFLFVYIENASATTPQTPDKDLSTRALQGVHILN